MKAIIHHPTQKTHGFTLVELLVAMVLGMLTTVIIAEVLLKTEGNKRTSVGGNDAQVNGALSLYALQRDIQMAGYGVASKATALGCAIKGKRGATEFTATLAPVAIGLTNGGGPDQSDTITVLSSATTRFAVPMDLSVNHTAASSTFTVKSALGVSAGDFLLAIPNAPSASKGCTMFQATAVDAATGSITHATTSTWNTVLSDATYVPNYVSDDDSLVNVGALQYRQYSIDSSTNVLQSRDLSTSTAAFANPVTVNANIVLMKAMYGRDTNNDGTIDRFDDVISTAAEWATVRAVRVAIVARSAERDKLEVTASNPEWDVGTTATISATNNAVTCLPVAAPTRCVLPLTIPTASASASDNAEWKHYRYKVYDTLIPVRNMLWSS